MSGNSELHVIFGSGPAGRAVMRELLRRGRRVRIVNRSGKVEVPAGVEVVGADATRPEDARRACQGAAVVYQCTNPSYTRWVELFPSLQAGVLEGAASASAKLIAAENLYMYGEVAGLISEDLPYRATTRKGQVRARMAETLMDAHLSGKVRVAIGRASDFFGPYVLASGMGERVFYPALQGKSASTVGSLDQPHTFTFIDDFGKALVTLGEREEALGQTWHVPNAETLTQRQFITRIYAELGLPPRISTAGRLMLRMIGMFIPDVREVVEMMYEFEEPFIVDDSKFRRTFGTQATPLPEAIRQTIDWYRQNPK